MIELCEKHGEAHTVLYPGIEGTERCALCLAIDNNKVLVDLLHKAYHELNTIHARDGVPRTHQGFRSSVSQSYFTQLVEDMRDALEEMSRRQIKATIARALGARK